jgi:hypothetical protein
MYIVRNGLNIGFVLIEKNRKNKSFFFFKRILTFSFIFVILFLEAKIQNI